MTAKRLRTLWARLPVRELLSDGLILGGVGVFGFGVWTAYPDGAYFFGGAVALAYGVLLGLRAQ